MTAPNQNGTLHKALNHQFGKALHAYDMIQDGDHIAVGFSGGKDSWALLWLLTERLRRIPIRYTLSPIYIDLGFGDDAIRVAEEDVRGMGWDLHVEYTDFGIVAHSSANTENPCFLCARRRRQRLFDLAETLGCNKLALGHNKDDLIETLFLNMMYAGEMSTMLPKQLFFEGRLAVIRPLAYVEEADLERFATQMGWPIAPNACPTAGHSKRAEIKQLLKGLCGGNPKIKGNIFAAMRHVNKDYLLNK